MDRRQIIFEAVKADMHDELIPITLANLLDYYKGIQEEWRSLGWEGFEKYRYEFALWQLIRHTKKTLKERK